MTSFYDDIMGIGGMPKVNAMIFVVQIPLTGIQLALALPKYDR